MLSKDNLHERSIRGYAIHLAEAQAAGVPPISFQLFTIPPPNITAINNNNQTPLELAQLNNDIEIEEILVDDIEGFKEPSSPPNPPPPPGGGGGPQQGGKNKKRSKKSRSKRNKRSKRKKRSKKKRSKKR